MNSDPDKPVFGRRSPSQRVQSLEDPLRQEAYDEAPRAEKAAKKRSRQARGGLVRFLNLILSLLIVAAVGFSAVIWYGQSQFDAPGPLTEETTYIVPPGASFSSIVPGLEEKNIIPRQGMMRVFVRGVQAYGRQGDLKTGEFGFKPGMSMRQVMLELTDGKPIVRKLTFPEGWTSYQIVERLSTAETLEGPVPEMPPEGSLLPETYVYQRGTTREQIIARMREAQNEALAEIWAQREEGLPLKSPEELVILASIVEKETGVASERPHVASVFINRLRKGMRLETDPTVIYGIWGGKGKPKDRGGLRRSELRRETPYNTYQIGGLPPTPIANPGLASMQAVANPLKTDDLFFVADGTGGHVFAKTLEEHNANVRKWREIEAQQQNNAEETEKPDDGNEPETDN